MLREHATMPLAVTDTQSEMPPHDRAYIGRQPILDMKRRVVGHELLYRHDENASSARITNEFEACVKVVNNTLTNMNADWLLGDSAAFINITPELLDADPLDLLPSQRVVLEFSVEQRNLATLPAQIEHTRDLGFRIALEDLLPRKHTQRLVEAADYIKLDVQRFDTRTLAKAVEHFRRYPALKLIAKKIETMQEYLACAELGFDYFQGYYLAHPETLSVKVINPTCTTVLELLNKVNANSDVGELETCFKQNMALSFKLLRYINCAGFGNGQVQSIRHALAILGYRQLYRWLSLLLITSVSATRAPALIQMAIARGRFAELVGQPFLASRERDNLFIVGMFSMLDVVLETPLDSLVENLNLPQNIGDALRYRTGIYAPFLNLVEASENMDWKQVESLSQALHLPAENINQAHFEALVWAEQMVARQ
ncbi:MAG: EAL domain-containing protein [Sulfuricella sp.]|nr:EAL domain-containing protein [Sulfuricella sp.]